MPLRPIRRILRDAALVVALAVALALAVNGLRPTRGIPLFAPREYQVLVPCPEYAGKADPVAPAAALAGGRGTLLIDAREPAAFARWHPPGALSIPFDYLAPTDEARVRRVLSSGARQVVVFGDGQDPDSGQELAKELAGKGLRNVRYVRGGAPALRAAGGGGAP